jgi:hypothetical protein
MATMNLRNAGGGVPKSITVRSPKRKSASIAAGNAGPIDGRASIKRIPPGTKRSGPSGPPR